MRMRIYKYRTRYISDIQTESYMNMFTRIILMNTNKYGFNTHWIRDVHNSKF